MANTITLEDGRVFPAHGDKALSWTLTLTHKDQMEGYPRLRAVIRAMKELRPAQLERERHEMLKGSFDRMFGHNAKKVLNVIEEELSR